MSALKYWVWITTRPGVGAVNTLRLLEHFGSPEGAFYADPEEYALVEDFPKQLHNSLLDKSLDGVHRILGDCDKLDLTMLTLQDAQYPQRLRRIPDPPALLYCKGRNILFDEECAISVVGSRKPSAYGEQVAGRIGLDITRQGGLLISGIAQGIDTAALKGGLKGGGQVVSVLAGGIDVVYPYENRYLYQDVAATGALISEYPPGTKHQGNHFPVRNRIISGLSLGVVAVECRWHSGTMLTVNRALEQERDVFAVPGNVDAPMSDGPNRLIQQGAGLVRNGWDILREYSNQFPQKLREPEWMDEETKRQRLGEHKKPQPSAEKPSDDANVHKKTIDRSPERAYIDLVTNPELVTEDQRDILVTLGEKALLADDLVELTQIPTKRVLSALTLLQVQGYVAEEPGRRFRALVEVRQAEG